MNKTFIIIAAVILIALAIYFLADGRNTPAVPSLQDRTGGDEDTAPLVDIADYGSKVVYQTDVEADTAPLAADCESRGGTFNLCGDPCPPGAEACAAVCAYTCDRIAR